MSGEEGECGRIRMLQRENGGSSTHTVGNDAQIGDLRSAEGGRTDGRMDGRTGGRMDRWADGRTGASSKAYASTQCRLHYT